MKKIFSSFYARIAAVFLILLIIMGTVQILNSVRSSIDFVKKADQRMNAGLAKSIATEFEPFVGDTLDMESIKHMMHYLMVINPHIEIYLLDSTGSVMAFFAVPDKKVKDREIDLGPVKQLIASGHTAAVVGDDPRNPGRKKPFSAARLKITDDQQGYIYVILGGEQFDNAAAEIREGFLMSTVAGGLLVSLIFTAIIGLIVFFFMTRRLRRVTSGVIAFKEGDYQSRLEETSDDDFGQLSIAFNQMADRIVSNMNELKRVDDLRRELIANVSHDLRSPLASITGYLETIKIKRDALTDVDLDHYLDISLKNANKLSHLVSELFELSKLDAHQSEPHKELFSFSELAQDVTMKYKPVADKKSVKFDTDVEPDLPLVNADIGMIERVLTNLIENAIKFSPENGNIHFATSRVSGSVRVKVSDNGPGVPKDELPNIFQRYYRGNRKGSKDIPGAGLGLAITKKILELHNSDIKVESELNKGTTFYFDLKASPDQVKTTHS